MPDEEKVRDGHQRGESATYIAQKNALLFVNHCVRDVGSSREVDATQENTRHIHVTGETSSKTVKTSGERKRKRLFAET